MSGFRYHRYTNGTTAARALVTRPNPPAYACDVWVTDTSIFTGNPNPEETSVDHWFQRIVRGLRQTGCPALVTVSDPKTRQQYLVLP